MAPTPGTAANALGPPLQTYTAVYYVLADVLMLSLYFYYKFKKRPSPCEYGGPWVSGAWGRPGRLGGGGVLWLVIHRTPERLPLALSDRRGLMP